MALERFMASGGAGDSYSPDNFVTGEKQVTTINVVVESGAGVVPARSVLGVKDANGKAILSLSAGGDGTDVARYILVQEVDATSSDVTCQVYASGCFNPDLLNFGTGHTAATVKEDLRDRGILLKTPA